jgi:hypothetical protein
MLLTLNFYLHDLQDWQQRGSRKVLQLEMESIFFAIKQSDWMHYTARCFGYPSASSRAEQQRARDPACGASTLFASQPRRRASTSSPPPPLPGPLVRPGAGPRGPGRAGVLHSPSAMARADILYRKLPRFTTKLPNYFKISSWNVLSLLRSEVAYIGTGHILS